MKKNIFPERDDIRMSCNSPFCRRLLGAVMFAAVVVALISGSSASFAATGYWKYNSQQIMPTQEQLSAVKPLPGHVYELRVNGGLQAGPGSGKGSIDLFFKTDNADREVFLATSTLTFGANAPLAILTPGQKIMFEVSLVVGGNDKSRAVPATGSGTISIDSGENLVRTETRLGQTNSARGQATIPNGGPGASMVIHVQSYLAHLGAMNESLHIYYAWVEGKPPAVSAPAASRFGAVLGQALNVREVAGEVVYDGTWTRRAGTDIFDAVWNGTLRDVIEIESVNGKQIVFYRHGNQGRYFGTLSADGRQVVSGRASWYAAGWYWSAAVSGK
jgi:hypothetical protein